MDATRNEVLKQNATQHPQLTPAETPAKVFGGVGLGAKRSYVLVTPRDGFVKLNAGTMQGMAEGTILDVYPAGEREFKGAPIASITVSQAAELNSEANISGDATIPMDARAVVRSIPGFQFRVAFQGQSPAMKNVRDLALKTVAGLTASPVGSAQAVVRENSGNIEVRHQGFEALPNDRTNTTDPNASDTIVKALIRWSEWHLMLDRQGGPPALTVDIVDSSGAPAPSAKHGDTISVKICNRDANPWFAKIVDFSSDGTHDPFSFPDDAHAIAAGQCSTRPVRVTVTPDGAKSSVETFRVFATQNMADMTFFTSPSSRGDPDPNVKWSAVSSKVTVMK
jgi:hypothetical protein